MEYVARPHARNMVRWARERPDVLVFSADLTSSCEVNDFRDTYPDQFLSFGVAEQNMMSFAAGMAREGYFPFIHTFAVFICRRPFDQVAMSIGYPNLPVRMVGFLPGITTPGGVSHQAIDDVGLMRLIPNMTILECGDATDVESVLDVAHSVDGPVYIRMLRGEVPRLFDPQDGIVLSRARVLSSGDDVTIISAGICTEEAIRAVRALENRGVSANHLHVTTHKPFDDPRILEVVERARKGIVVMENHSVIGGLGAAVSTAMTREGLGGKKLVNLGLQDVYAHGASRDFLMRRYGLDARACVGAVENLIGQDMKIDDKELESVDPVVASADSKAEDL